MGQDYPIQARPSDANHSPEQKNFSEEQRSRSTLISRNITIDGRRTSMRLEPAMWDALAEICKRKKLTLHRLCSMVAEHKGQDTSFTAAIRVFAMSYYKAAATEEGHRHAGHGGAFLFTAKKDFAVFQD